MEMTVVLMHMLSGEKCHVFCFTKYIEFAASTYSQSRLGLRKDDLYSYVMP